MSGGEFLSVRDSIPYSDQPEELRSGCVGQQNSANSKKKPDRSGPEFNLIAEKNMVASQSLKIENAPVTLRELALEKIRQAIISGYFQAGDRLVERTLCNQLGVSRTVVREVIRYLEAEGLIENLPKKGPIVAVLTWQVAEQIYNIRMLLEQEAAWDCAKAATVKDKKLLHQKLSRIAKASRDHDDIERVKASHDFYEALFAIARHTIGWEIVQRLNSRISRLRALTLRSPERQVAGFERMLHIYEAIENNNPAGAKEAVRQHLTEAASLAKTILNADENINKEE